MAIEFTKRTSKLPYIKMAGRNSIKLFQFNQKYCEAIGIFLPRSNYTRYKLIVLNLIFIFSSAEFAMTSAAFLVYDATSMGEYGITFLILIGIMKAVVDYYAILWKLADFFKFIESCEAFIGKSKSERICF